MKLRKYQWGYVGGGGGGGQTNTTVVNTPAPRTPEEIEADRLRLAEMRRQNDLAERLLPGQQSLIEQQRRILDYQIAHQGDLDEYNNQQLRLANLQIQAQIEDAAMRTQLQPLQLEYLQNSNRLANQQIDALREATDFQREQNAFIREQNEDAHRRLVARNAAYSPEEEATAAAEEARRATRMGIMSEEAAKEQLRLLKQGTKPTDEQLANINEAYDASQKIGEGNISKYLQDTLRQINEETAQAAGLRSTDAPVVRLSERAGEAAAKAQGDLTTSIEGQRAQARLNYPLAASQLAGNQASQLQQTTAAASNFQDQLRLQANNNRTQAFGLPQSAGFAMPQSGPTPGLGFMGVGASGINPNYNANSLFASNFNRGGGTQQTNQNTWNANAYIGFGK